MKKALGFALQISTDPVSNNCLCFGPNRHLRLIISTLVIFTFGSTKKMKEFIIWYCFCCWLQYSWECEWITCGGISSTHIERGLTSRFALVIVALTTEWQTGCIVGRLPCDHLSYWWMLKTSIEDVTPTQWLYMLECAFLSLYIS